MAHFSYTYKMIDFKIFLKYIYYIKGVHFLFIIFVCTNYEDFLTCNFCHIFVCSELKLDDLIIKVYHLLGKTFRDKCYLSQSIRLTYVICLSLSPSHCGRGTISLMWVDDEVSQ